MKLKITLFTLLFFTMICAKAQNQWPKDIPFKNGGKATVYQPQPEKLEGNKITGRSAISVKETASSEAIFGAIFYKATISTDKSNRTARLESLTITNAKFPGVDSPEKIQKLTNFIETEVPKWNMEISLDALVATIQKLHPNAPIYKNDPPKIIYKTKPTTVVILDGEPKIQKDKNLDAERVINSPSLIFKEGSQWNMYNGGVWYKSNAITSGWTEEKNMSAKVKSINTQIKKQETSNNDGKEVATKPQVTEIIVATEPTEVIQSKGEAVYKNIQGTSLNYVSNTSDNIFKHDNNIYILLAGRWYKSLSFEGPWTFNEPDKLPLDFSKIPEGSEKDCVLASVAGTTAAEEAMIDAEIPQTAKIDRKKATVKVEYDGTPKFSEISGTSLQYAENSNLTILKENSGNYFALDNGVWFTSNYANGPWSVATTRPRDVDEIPMQSPVYNSKFVHIYEVTDTYTVQGYTAGYLGSYIQGDPVIVFGTGYHYQPWYGSVYYPRPATWGFGFTYNPWTGWSMNVSYNIGFMTIGFNFGPSYGPNYVYGGGWFGPPMYRPPYYRPPYGGGGYYGRPNYGGNNNHGNIHNGNNNININVNNSFNNNHNNLYNNKPGIVTKTNERNVANNSRIGNNNSNRSNSNNQATNNLNNNRSNSNATKSEIINNRPNAKTEKGTTNNVFADKDGNVFNKDEKGNINKRDNVAKDWKPNNNLSNPVNNIAKDAELRDRGNQRTNNFEQQATTRPAMQRTQRNNTIQRPSGATMTNSVPQRNMGGAAATTGGGVRRR